MVGNVIAAVVLLAIFFVNISTSIPTLIAIQVSCGLSLVLLMLFLEHIAKFLLWIQRNTANGAVGIIGFALYAAGVLMREGAYVR
jgi:hypothetical protein